ncbi:MAG: RNA polymerase factor sigma-54 [Gammaproteobacteria bacterium]
MLKPSLQVRLGQQLTMTPQLQQAIRLLQLSSLELKAEIQEAFECNPMLETDEENPEESQIIEKPDSENDSSENDTHDIQEITANDTLPDDLPVDSQWDDVYEPSHTPISQATEDYSDYLENQSSDEHDTLQQHLLWQLELSSLSNQDRTIANSLIDALDDSGYLQESVESIHENLIKDYEIELDEVEAVLKFVQRLDPIGSGSRNLQECLTIQLQQLPDEVQFLAEARLLVESHLDLIASKDYKQLLKLTKFSPEAIENSIALIQTLHPRPGDLISSQKPEYIVPDVYVDKHKGLWRVKLNMDSAPKLRINDVYSALIKNSSNNSETDYMRNQLQEARWFIKSLQSRNETLMRVATSIVRYQRSFFEYGEEAMRPLVLRDIAEELEMHESTISRVTTNKYMDSPRGIFEFKYFFSSHVSTKDGGICSATAIRAMIKKLINEENQTKPLSDNKIATALEQKGISVARRTIAKYRESMAIPPSNERKQYA